MFKFVPVSRSFTRELSLSPTVIRNKKGGVRFLCILTMPGENSSKLIGGYVNER